MQFSMKDGVAGMLLQFTANLSSKIASRWEVPPQLQHVIMLFNGNDEVTFSFNAGGDNVPVSGLCLEDGTCRNPDASCYGGLCFDN